MDRPGLDSLLADRGPVHTICHLATEPPGDGPRRGTNDAGTRNLLAAARDAGVRHVVFASTMSVFDFLEAQRQRPLTEACPTAPRDAYGAEKLQAESICAGSDGPPTVTVLRFAGVYGPGKDRGAVHQFLRCAVEGKPVDIAADRAVDLLWVGDAVAALLATIDEPPASRLLHIGSGAAVPLSEVARQAGEAVGATLEVRVSGGGNHFCLDVRRARAEIGYQPTPLAQTLRCFAGHLAPSPVTEDHGSGTA
jgi:nucleoside-diphosphate-sugar epimerase